jgi:hypothetical protein
MQHISDAISKLTKARFSRESGHRAKKMVTEHGGRAPGEKPLNPVGIQLALNLSCMNESHGSRSNIRTVSFRSTLCSN